MGNDPNELFLPRPAWMSCNDLHPWEIPGQGVEMNGPAVIQRDALPPIHIGSQNGKSHMEHNGFVARLQNLPDFVISFIVGIKTLIRRMELEAFNFRVSQ
jgi:hypothetical protein